MSRDIVFLLMVLGFLSTIMLFFRLMGVPRNKWSFVDILSNKTPLLVLGLGSTSCIIVGIYLAKKPTGISIPEDAIRILGIIIFFVLLPFLSSVFFVMNLRCSPKRE